MAVKLRNLLFFTMLHFFITHPTLIESQRQIPCIFFMGDSLIDNGNNNYITTRSRENYLPYGIDYPGGPTGRFSNGKNLPDFLAKFLGFKKSIMPFASAKGRDILNGVNYASGAAGILTDSGKKLGNRISMDMQLSNHQVTILRMKKLLRNSSVVNEHLKKCLYVVNIGSNDYLNNYLLPKDYISSTLYSPTKFAKRLINVYKKQLRRLYRDGARKVAVFGLGLLGCVPQVVSEHPTNSGTNYCIESINKMTMQLNDRLPTLINALNADLIAAQFIMINSTGIATFSTGHHSAIGNIITNASCCVVSDKTTGLCDRGKKPCSNRNEYFFWDKIHPTESANKAIATRAYTAALPTDAYPFDITHLVRK